MVTKTHWRKKTRFAQGDKVFDGSYGYGQVVEITPDHRYPVVVEFDTLEDERVRYTHDGRLWQEDPITLENKT